MGTGVSGAEVGVGTGGVGLRVAVAVGRIVDVKGTDGVHPASDRLNIPAKIPTALAVTRPRCNLPPPSPPMASPAPSPVFTFDRGLPTRG